MSWSCPPDVGCCFFNREEKLREAEIFGTVGYMLTSVFDSDDDKEHLWVIKTLGQIKMHLYIVI